MTKGQEEADDEAVGEDEGSAAAHFSLHADGPATAGNQLQSRPLSSVTFTLICHQFFSETRSTRTQRSTGYFSKEHESLNLIERR
jgi:hypothetical protein